MGRYIHGERDGIHIIDLLQTQELLEQARSSAPTSPERTGRSCSSGTKKQARDAIQEWAERSGMPFVNQRWLGGLLTNFSTISKRIEAARPHEPRQRGSARSADEGADGEEAELRKLEYSLGGVRDMKRLPQAVFIVDLKTEAIAAGGERSDHRPGRHLRPRPCRPRDPRQRRLLRAGDHTVGEAVSESAAAWRTEGGATPRRGGAQAAEEAERGRAEERKQAEEAAEAAAREAEAQGAEQGAGDAAKPEGSARGGATAGAAPEAEGTKPVEAK